MKYRGLIMKSAAMQDPTPAALQEMQDLINANANAYAIPLLTDATVAIEPLNWRMRYDKTLNQLLGIAS